MSLSLPLSVRIPTIMQVRDQRSAVNVNNNNFKANRKFVNCKLNGISTIMQLDYVSTTKQDLFGIEWFELFQLWDQRPRDYILPTRGPPDIMLSLQYSVRPCTAHIRGSFPGNNRKKLSQYFPYITRWTIPSNLQALLDNERHFAVGERIMAKIGPRSKWQPGQVIEEINGVTFNVLLDDRRLRHLHPNQLKPTAKVAEYNIPFDCGPEGPRHLA